MTMLEALAEIERKHPGYSKPKWYSARTAYWYYTWKRDEYGCYYIVDTNDECWEIIS